MNLTMEQQKVVDYTKNVKGEKLITIDSVAGSGKTTILQTISTELGDKPGLYLAYNKSVATSSKRKFPSYIDCRTTHSLAYGATVKSLNLRVGFLNAGDIREKIPYLDKYLLTEDIREFCLSKYLNYDDFAVNNNRTNTTLANLYLNKMINGDIDCTHDFYLKLFHKMLANDDINQTSYNLIMLDEAGDLNEVTLEIFRLLKGRVKVAVGDPHQNIYTFNHTINCFEELEGEGKDFKLSKSFRVPTHIATSVEKFCQKYINPDMKFEGIPIDKNKPIKTTGYISRTNGGLIMKLIELNKSGKPYGLVRKAQEIFKTCLMVAGLKYQGNIYDPAYKDIQDQVDDWHENKNNIKQKHTTLFAYLKFLYEEDLALIQAINLVSRYGSNEIFNAYKEAKKHEGKKHDLSLLTAHSSKGLEFDEVILSPDMDSSIDKIVEELVKDPSIILSTTDKESLNLYYVAATRALVSLRNASYLR